MWDGKRVQLPSGKGFALPTILIASTVMLAILASTMLTVSAAVTSGIENRYYESFAKNAAQSGVAMAQACLKRNNYVAQWSSNPLRPNTDCTGTVQSSVSEYIHNTEGVQSTFSVPAPTTLANGVQRVSVNASAQRLRASSGAPWRSYQTTSYATISAQSSFSNVTFGYSGYAGAFFGVVSPEGVVSAAGFNQYGQLGNGTVTDSPTPRPFILPTGVRASQLFTSFLSVGQTMFAVTTDGRVYGAGRNNAGQLGNGSIAANQSTPVQFAIPGGAEAKYISVGMEFTYVLANNHNVYSAGNCYYGVLGQGGSIAGCANSPTPQRVALPTVNTSDLNTLPVETSDYEQATNLVTDRYNGYVRMQGGRVYGWGDNIVGQLGNGTRNASATPLQITNLGNAGQPTATQLAFEGTTVWILDSNGDVWATGANNHGSIGTPAPLVSGSNKCIDNPGNGETNGTRIQIYDCNDTTAQMVEWAEDGSLVFRPNSSTVKCIDNANNSQANGNAIQLYDCNNSAAQKWTMNDSGKIVLQGTNKCIDNPGSSATNGTQLHLWDCNGTAGFANQTWSFREIISPQKVILPSGQGKVRLITTDQWTVLFLMTNGTVWGYGLSSSGQLGNGSLSYFNPRISQLILPAGRTAVRIYTTKSGVADDLQYANTYVVLDDGSVYGTGSNSFGQLGNGGTASAVATPVKMTLPAGVVARSVQTGYGTTVVLTQEGRIYTVGNNTNGQLGDGTTTNSSVPIARQYVNSRPLVLY
jgi:alpha-tubulin suppressor-like RCC1 family protein